MILKLYYDETASFTNQPMVNIYRSYGEVVRDNGQIERVSIHRAELMARRGTRIFLTTTPTYDCP